MKIEKLLQIIYKIPFIVILLIYMFYLISFLFDRNIKLNIIQLFVEHKLPMLLGMIHWVIWCLFATGGAVALGSLVMLTKSFTPNWLIFISFPVIFFVNIIVSYVIGAIVPIWYIWEFFVLIIIFLFVR